MQPAALFCNVMFLASTLSILATDGLSSEPAFALLTLLLILVPVSTVLMLGSSATLSHRSQPRLLVVAVSNVALLGAISWVLVAQQHSPESGVVPYVVLAALTPSLSAVTLFIHAHVGRTLP